ncbi:MAG: YceI family protein [Imperialibacter sp.]|uniref:YceI family protein n=1 Tax=Imperialibacter sp. TaxID=2038411 RepID=UPI0032EFC2DB
MKKYLTAIIMIPLLFGAVYFAKAQSMYSITPSKSNEMKLSGTSSLHDWEMESKTFTSEAEFCMTPELSTHLSALKSLSFTLPVVDLKGDKSGLNNNAYEALHSDKYKNIGYTQVSAIVFEEKLGKTTIKSTGNLTIAGTTKEVVLDVLCIVNPDATITCSGSQKLQMSDYKVVPPSFMFGAMKTGNDIALDFTVVYKQ